MLLILWFDTVAVRYEARLEDGTVVGRSEGAEFTVKDGQCCIFLTKRIIFCLMVRIWTKGLYNASL